MATHGDNRLDAFLEKTEKRARSARLLSIVLTIIPLVMAVLFLLITLKQIQKSRTELSSANEELNRVAEESSKLGLANEEAKTQLEITQTEIDSAIDKLENILESPLTANARTVIKDAISSIRGANTTLNEAKVDLDSAKQEPSTEPRRSLQALISDLFSDQARVRLRAYDGIIAYYGTDARLIPELLSYARDHMDNANGIYNTLVVLSRLDKVQLKPHIDAIQTFARQVEAMGGARTKVRVDKLLSRLPK